MLEVIHSTLRPESFFNDVLDSNEQRPKPLTVASTDMLAQNQQFMQVPTKHDQQESGAAPLGMARGACGSLCQKIHAKLELGSGALPEGTARKGGPT